MTVSRKLFPWILLAALAAGLLFGLILGFQPQHGGGPGDGNGDGRGKGGSGRGMQEPAPVSCAYEFVSIYTLAGDGKIA